MNMEIGVGFPGLFGGVDRDLIFSWARRAEEAEFACLSSGERLASTTPELMTTMAMVGAVTERIRLMSTVALLPLHSTGFITKQVATLDVLTRGRFTFGVGVGHRPQDYAAAEIDKARRLDRFEHQLAFMKRQWAALPADGEPQIGPPTFTPGGPRVLIGPLTAKSARRAPLADGIATFGASPADHVPIFESALQAWKQAGRAGRPYFAAGAFFALGPGSDPKCRQYLEWHHSAGPVEGHYTRAMLPEDRVSDAMKAFADIGVDEFYFVPTIAEVDQVDRLAELVLGDG
jgi:alkanesulfonate monooxygenase SsuD/methylene tetrahydromethanopterin reductase-like flavin-dependent oxidoreductase (luciferase family)